MTSGGGWLAAVVVVLLALAGCKSHQQLAADAEGVELRASAGATIVAIDDKKVASGAKVNTGVQTVRAPAGKHKVSVFTHGSHGGGEWIVPLTLEAGHAYRFGSASQTALSLQVVDETSGRVIVGPSGSQSPSPARVNVAPPPSPPSARP